ncbi:hypothetical protein HMPREF0201_03879 [Cedecea davisae DSM 4568]|uniref:Uncharacterized protein n=1 Tax=Cedecea davisae DSM 4568 TaxID=566551 RepID=S3IIK5_9ENTR|nr:hypothetical protein HMPREF0201_03879 [Cedecea davisae DSM 4568]
MNADATLITWLYARDKATKCGVNPVNFPVYDRISSSEINIRN